MMLVYSRPLGRIQWAQPQFINLISIVTVIFRYDIRVGIQESRSLDVVSVVRVQASFGTQGFCAKYAREH